ncbi:MAG: hypothetical protein AAF362_05240 [Pseudomonadota bacterium]
MSGVQDKKLITALKYAKVTALVLALSSAGVLIQGSNWVYASDTPADAESGSENDAGAGGANSAGAGQGSTSTAETNSDPNGDASATGTGAGGAGAQGTSGGKDATAHAETDTMATADKDGDKYTAEGTANATVPGGTVGAEVDVTYDRQNEISANAKTTEDGHMVTQASSVLNGIASAMCGGTCDTSFTKDTRKKSEALAIQGDHMSYTISNRSRSYAYAGATAEFDSKNMRGAGLVAAETWAEATGNYSKAHSRAEAHSRSGQNKGGVAKNEWLTNVVKQQQKWAKKHKKRMKPFAWANSKSYAKVCVGQGCRPAEPVFGRDLGGECEWRYRTRDGQFMFPPVCIYPDVVPDPNN